MVNTLKVRKKIGSNVNVVGGVLSKKELQRRYALVRLLGLEDGRSLPGVLYAGRTGDWHTAIHQRGVKFKYDYDSVWYVSKLSGGPDILNGAQIKVNLCDNLWSDCILMRGRYQQDQKVHLYSFKDVGEFTYWGCVSFGDIHFEETEDGDTYITVDAANKYG